MPNSECSFEAGDELEILTPAVYEIRVPIGPRPLMTPLLACDSVDITRE
jgi:hypothetical protein